jgi:hypothetical protein
VLFLRDKRGEAIEIQEKAVKLADDGAKANFEKALASYKEGRLPADD